MLILESKNLVRHDDRDAKRAGLSEEYAMKSGYRPGFGAFDEKSGQIYFSKREISEFPSQKFILKEVN